MYSVNQNIILKVKITLTTFSKIIAFSVKPYVVLERYDFQMTFLNKFHIILEHIKYVKQKQNIVLLWFLYYYNYCASNILSYT